MRPQRKRIHERERERDMVGVPYIMLSPSPQDVPRSRFVTARKKQSCHCEQVGQWTPTCWENTNQSLTQEEQGWPRKYKCWTMSCRFVCDVWLREMRFKIQIVYLRPVSSYTGTHWYFIINPCIFMFLLSNDDLVDIKIYVKNVLHVKSHKTWHF